MTSACFVADINSRSHRHSIAAVFLVLALGGVTSQGANGDLSGGYVCDVVPKIVPRNPPESWPLCSPQFIIAGTEKSGTTSTFEYLKAHPDFLPSNGTFLLDRASRSRLVRTIMKLKELHKPPPAFDMVFNGSRLRRMAGNLTEEEVLAATEGNTSLLKIWPQEIERAASPVLLGKEVRFYTSGFRQIAQGLNISENVAYGLYVDVFPRVPAPPAADDGAVAEVPPHLAENIGKVTGEASPQYLLSTNYMLPKLQVYAPSTRVMFILREPVKRMFSHARMIEGMKGSAIDPTVAVFEANVQRCIGTGGGGVTPKAAKSNNVSGGGALARMRGADWSSDKIFENADWHALQKDMQDCVSHKLARFFFQGMYAQYMREWLARYPREQLLLLPSEELFIRPLTTLHKIAAFAGLRQVPDEVWKDAVRFRHSPLFAPQNITWSLRTEPALNAAAASGDSAANPALSAAALAPSRSGFSPEIEELLAAYYAGPNCVLRQMLGQDWSVWGWRYCDEASVVHSDGSGSGENLRILADVTASAVGSEDLRASDRLEI
eukprot:TRINITY_DN16238_c0_g1_i1.p1 TRINITY_DN16238_c0_g1~~TRINITY_DN16238_c0_g1_i1.p1  ORF type:complete len:549 (+),score=77.78 TRINITY_DN16238_c0_g1_i1:92-1738(+)